MDGLEDLFLGKPEERTTLRHITDVKAFLDSLLSDTTVASSDTWVLPEGNGLSNADWSKIEDELRVGIPPIYKSYLSAFDWRMFGVSHITVHATVDAILEANDPHNKKNMWVPFYRQYGLVEIGRYHKEPICIRTRPEAKQDRVVLVDLSDLPNLNVRLICYNFEKLIVIATIILEQKVAARYFQWSAERVQAEQHELIKKTMNMIYRYEPIAQNIDFWERVIRGMTYSPEDMFWG